MDNLRKIWAITWRELYVTFTDRTLIIIMIITPLVLSTIIGLAFGGSANGDVAIKGIPVAIVNLDTGNGQTNLGDFFVSAFVPPADGKTATSGISCDAAQSSSEAANNTTLYELTTATKLDDPAAARAGVDKGDYVAAVIIPEDFTAKTSVTQSNAQIQSSAVEVYANAGKPVSAGIIRSIVEAITSQLATGNIAVAATLEKLQQRMGLLPFGAAALNFDFVKGFGCAFTPAFNTIQIAQQTVTGNPASTGALAILVLVGSAQAMFFALFTAQGSIGGTLEERRQWTLQRLIVSPTPRIVIVTGKLLGSFVTVAFQLVALFVALSVVGSILHGGIVLIWGTNLVAVLAIILAAALAASGVSILLVGIAKTAEQGQIFGSVVNIALAVLGGAFGVQLPRVAAQFSMIYWSTDAFHKLADGEGDIGLNLLVLAVQGAIMFGIGFWLFNQRLDI
jgi:ABC-2 type transport system permease protein